MRHHRLLRMNTIKGSRKNSILKTEMNLQPIDAGRWICGIANSWQVEVRMDLRFGVAAKFLKGKKGPIPWVQPVFHAAQFLIVFATHGFGMIRLMGH